MAFKGLFQPKAFNDSMIPDYRIGLSTPPPSVTQMSTLLLKQLLCYFCWQWFKANRHQTWISL